jgi:hypothetical protein
MKPWHLGNTTVRSPFRLRAALLELKDSELLGNLRGAEQEIAFRELLGKAGIVSLGEDRTYSVGRKWRSALSKMGFIIPKTKTKNLQKAVGQADTISPLGMHLIKADTLPAIQECYLRSLASYYLPSPLDTAHDFKPFSPLRHLLRIMLDLKKHTGNSQVSIQEIGLIIQFTSGEDKLKKIREDIIDFRQRRSKATNKRKFDQDETNRVAKKNDYVAGTFRDYADTNIRYLKSTGLFQNAGRGIALREEKTTLITSLSLDISVPSTESAFYESLSLGSKLPTDDIEVAKKVLAEIVDELRSNKIALDTKTSSAPSAQEISNIRFRAEEALSEQREIAYYKVQATYWEEITYYLDLFVTGKMGKSHPKKSEIIVPKAEAPAYLEWILWRSFLAINGLLNAPFKARKFKVDQDFLPIGTAPGGGPDLFFEFGDFNLVVEVTLTESSRQETVEGESVRRHTASHASQNKDKPTYCLFIARNIDMNTYETFRKATWYHNDGSLSSLGILPLTISQFKSCFESMFRNNSINSMHISNLIGTSLMEKNDLNAPSWQKLIEDNVNKIVARLHRLNIEE